MPYIGKEPARVPVTAADIPDDSITAAKIVDGVITAADIGANAVGNSEMADDAVGVAELSATGTASNTTFLRGDNSWQTVTSYTHPNHSGEVTSTADGAQVIADNVVDEANLKISNSPTNGQFLSAQSGNTGGLTWATATTDISSKLSLSGGTMTGNIAHAGAFTIDAGTDITLDSDGGNLYIADGGTNIGNLGNDSTHFAIMSTVNDADIKFKGKDGGSTITALSLDMSDGGVATFNAGAQFGGNVLWPDNQKILIGTGADLQIYHDGSDSIIADTGTGDLLISGSSTVRIDGSGETMINCTDDGAVTLYHNNAAKIATTATGVDVTGGAVMGGTIVGSGTSNTVGGASALTLGESNFRIMTGGEQHVLCLDRDNAGGDKKIMQSWNPDSGDVAIGSAGPVAAGRLMIKPTSLTQAQLKLQGVNYSYGTELHSQNGSEGGTVGNTRQFFKIEHVTNGYTRTMYTTSSQIGTDTHKWETNNTTKMFLHDYGKLDLYSETTQWNMACYAGGTGNQYFIDFRLQDNTQVGHIDTTGSSVTYATSSDYRLKENVDYTWDATTRLKQLKPARFNFIADDTNTLVDGFLAHEVSSIVPEAVTGEKDAMTAEVLYLEADDLPEGKSVGDVKEASVPDMQGIDQSKLVPLLVKTIQELEARITVLEA